MICTKCLLYVVIISLMRSKLEAEWRGEGCHLGGVASFPTYVAFILLLLYQNLQRCPPLIHITELSLSVFFWYILDLPFVELLIVNGDIGLIAEFSFTLILRVDYERASARKRYTQH